MAADTLEGTVSLADIMADSPWNPNASPSPSTFGSPSPIKSPLSESSPFSKPGRSILRTKTSCATSELPFSSPEVTRPRILADGTTADYADSPGSTDIWPATGMKTP
eukprot:gene16413-5010_t